MMDKEISDYVIVTLFSPNYLYTSDKFGQELTNSIFQEKHIRQHINNSSNCPDEDPCPLLCNNQSQFYCN